MNFVRRKVPVADHEVPGSGGREDQEVRGHRLLAPVLPAHHTDRPSGTYGSCLVYPTSFHLVGAIINHIISKVSYNLMGYTSKKMPNNVLYDVC
jgi:hypothetical protein